jgi:hypothetical protein
MVLAYKFSSNLNLISSLSPHISNDLSGEEKLAKLMRRHENNYHVSKDILKGRIAELKVA